MPNLKKKIFFLKSSSSCLRLLFLFSSLLCFLQQRV